MRLVAHSGDTQGAWRPWDLVSSLHVDKKIKVSKGEKKNDQIKQSQKMAEGPNLHWAWGKSATQRFWVHHHYRG